MKFRDPLPISKKWSIVIRCVLYGLPFAIIIAGFKIQTSGCPPMPYKTLAVCTELEQAVQRFYDDNGVLPIEVGADVTIDSNSAKGMELLRVLLDLETGDAPRNAKGVKYLNIKQGRGNIDGLIYDEVRTMVEGLYDPWGGSYRIRLDGDMNEEIEVQPKAHKEPRKLQCRVAVWSDGKDPKDPKDDVCTW